MGNEWCAVHNSTTKCGPCTYAHAQKNTAVRVRYNHSVNPTPTPTCCACASWALLRPIVVLVPSHVCKKGTVHKKGRLTVSELVTACCSACGEVQAETSLAEARRTCRYVLERRYKQNVRCHDLEQRATRVPSSTKLNRLRLAPCSNVAMCTVHWPLHATVQHIPGNIAIICVVVATAC